MAASNGGESRLKASFENDLFISYAHLDNQPFEEGVPGWIEQLHRHLAVKLSHIIGQKPRIFRDPKLKGNDDFSERLSAELPRAALLLSILSPRYLRSEWCLRELLEFRAAAEKAGGLKIGSQSRIFKVVKTPVPLEEQPEELRKMTGYEFFWTDPDSGRPYEIDPVLDPETRRQYYKLIHDLAYDISELYKLLEEQHPEDTATPDAGGEGEAGTVYLAETVSDLRPAREDLRRDLEMRGYRVLPDEPLPPVADELTAAAASQLAESRISIHLVGRSYGLIPEGATDSIVVLQNRLAIERAEAEADFTRLVWLPPELEIEDQRQLDFITELRTRDLGRRADLFETPLETLKSEIRRRLEPPGDEPEPAAAGEDGVLGVYFVCDQRDSEEATGPLEDFLFQQGFNVILPAFEGSETEVRLDHQAKLRLADAVLIYYGAGKDMWLQRKLSELRKSPGYGRTGPFVAEAVYVAPPPSRNKRRLRLHGTEVLRGGEEFAAADLEPFVARLREAEARRTP